MMEPTDDAGSVEKQPLGPVVQIDEGRIQAHLDGVVRSTVEEALNALLDFGGRPSLRSPQVRTHRRTQGHASGQL
jgi:hypothetical protein